MRGGTLMELCPECLHMRAERNHYTGQLVCYNPNCEIESATISRKKHGGTNRGEVTSGVDDEVTAVKTMPYGEQPTKLWLK
jgi:hypothetical protein